MKYGFFVLILLCGSLKCQAQVGSKYLSLFGGMGNREIYIGSISLDFNKRYYNQNELFGEWVRSSRTQYQTLIGGFVVKPVLVRSNNSTLRFRIGAGIGNDSRNVVAAPQLGVEFSQTFGNRVDLVFSNKNQAVLGAPKPEIWRLMLGMGLRFPLN